MARPTSTEAKLDLIIDSIQEIREMRKDVISLVEWKNSVNDKLDTLELKPHDCVKSEEIGSLKSTIESINKFKWWFLGILFMIASSVLTFGININNMNIENKVGISTNKENIIKLDTRVDRISEHGDE